MSSSRMLPLSSGSKIDVGLGSGVLSALSLAGDFLDRQMGHSLTLNHQGN
ncbi:MAG: hypothetical protein ABI180_00445 [Microcoleus sp.]